MESPESIPPISPPGGPAVVLGAGYAGLTVASGIARRSKGRVRVILVARRPVHVLRTELYEVGKLAESGDDLSAWVLPLRKILDGKRVDFRAGTVTKIDLEERRIHLEDGELSYGALAICLGSVAAYYGVPGAPENTHQVYRLEGAQKFARALREVESKSPDLPPRRQPRIVVVGGGSTGTELAAEIATTDWGAITVPGARTPEVVLVTGSVPFLAELPESLIEHARILLRRAGVAMIQGVNVTKVEPNRVHLEDGSILAFDLCVWCAGLQAPPVVAELPVTHGRGGRIAVNEFLEIPNHPATWGVGDVIEFKDPTTGMAVPGTAQAALAEARVAAANLVAHYLGQPAVPFRYREKGVVVAVGVGRASGRVKRITLWGSPAALVKAFAQQRYARSAEKGEVSSLL